MVEPEAEVRSVTLINQLRRTLNLPDMQIEPDLTQRARAWAETMADAGTISHSNPLSTGLEADWVKLGENVGVGGTVEAIHDAFVASPTHYANLIEPTFNYVGVGVIRRDTRIYVAHEFMAGPGC
jgi:uncharacterized protein YkwD